MSLGQWHRVVAERNLREGHLRVDQGPVEKKTSPGKAQGLNIHTPMYLGGVHQLDFLPKPANITQMFKGCIGEVGGHDETRRAIAPFIVCVVYDIYIYTILYFIHDNNNNVVFIVATAQTREREFTSHSDSHRLIFTLTTFQNPLPRKQ